MCISHYTRSRWQNHGSKSSMKRSTFEIPLKCSAHNIEFKFQDTYEINNEL